MTAWYLQRARARARVYLYASSTRVCVCVWMSSGAHTGVMLALSGATLSGSSSFVVAAAKAKASGLRWPGMLVAGALGLGAASGALLPLQAAVNARLARALASHGGVGGVEGVSHSVGRSGGRQHALAAATVSFAGGALALGGVNGFACALAPARYAQLWTPFVELFTTWPVVSMAGGEVGGVNSGESGGGWLNATHLVDPSLDAAANDDSSARAVMASSSSSDNETAAASAGWFSDDLAAGGDSGWSDDGEREDGALVQWWMISGGLLGVVIVVAAIRLTPRLGQLGFFTATIVGQLGAALALDLLGAFSLAPRVAGGRGDTARTGCAVAAACLGVAFVAADDTWNSAATARRRLNGSSWQVVS